MCFVKRKERKKAPKSFFWNEAGVLNSWVYISGRANPSAMQELI